MNQKPVPMIKGQKLAELLDRPLGGRMCGDIEVQNSPRTNLHRDKYIEDPKFDRDGNKEVAGDNGLGVISDECRPALLAAGACAPQKFDPRRKAL
jgi:hypothetical protein